MLLLAIAPSHGKAHNIVYCYAYFCLLWHQEEKKSQLKLQHNGVSEVIRHFMHQSHKPNHNLKLNNDVSVHASAKAKVMQCWNIILKQEWKGKDGNKLTFH